MKKKHINNNNDDSKHQQESVIIDCDAFRIMEDENGSWRWAINRQIDKVTSYIVFKSKLLENYVQQVSPLEKEKCKAELFYAISAAHNIRRYSFPKIRIFFIFRRVNLSIKKSMTITYLHNIPHRRISIYMHNNGDLVLHNPNRIIFSENESTVISRFKEILTESNISLNRKEKININRRLAAVLREYLQYTEIDISTIMKKFDKIETSLNNRISENAKYNILYVALFLTAFVSFFTLLYYNKIYGNVFLQNALIGGTSGMFGALTSILLRRDNIQINYINPVLYYLTQTISRLVLGICFGIIISLMIESELITFLTVKNMYGLSLFGILAGFSERFVPDYLDKLSNKHSSNDIS